MYNVFAVGRLLFDPIRFVVGLVIVFFCFYNGFVVGPVRLRDGWWQWLLSSVARTLETTFLFSLRIALVDG